MNKSNLKSKSAKPKKVAAHRKSDSAKVDTSRGADVFEFELQVGADRFLFNVKATQIASGDPKLRIPYPDW